jgi:hypothetical protein
MSLSELSTDTISRLVVIVLALAVLLVNVLWVLLLLVGQWLGWLIHIGSQKWYDSSPMEQRTLVRSYILRPLVWLEKWVL